MIPTGRGAPATRPGSSGSAVARAEAHTGPCHAAERGYKGRTHPQLYRGVAGCGSGGDNDVGAVATADPWVERPT
jgi:hypothetical protein